MSRLETVITVSGIDVRVVRKAIKNLHLAVYPPHGHVRVAVPEHVTDDNIRLAVVAKLSWIKKQQRDFHDQPRQSAREFVSGECHYFLGKRYRLEVIERRGKHEIKRLQSGKLKMFVQPGTTTNNREKLLNGWYRQQLNTAIPELLNKWQPIVGEQVSEFGVKKMKTKWGSCNCEQRRIWLNLELAKKPPKCLEYILVHELVHLLERNHNDRFMALMDRFLPKWRVYRDVLNKSPLGHEDWLY